MFDVFFRKCDFTAVLEYFDEQREIKKGRSKEEKQEEKERNAKITEEYGFCMWDHHKEKIGNFRLEPPGLKNRRGLGSNHRFQDCSVDEESTQKWAS